MLLYDNFYIEDLLMLLNLTDGRYCSQSFIAAVTCSRYGEIFVSVPVNFFSGENQSCSQAKLFLTNFSALVPKVYFSKIVRYALLDLC